FQRGRQDMSKGRGFGPFTGGQLTIITVVLIVVLLFPVSAWAAYSVAHVTITDNGGVNVAGVDAKHNVNVALHDASSGIAEKVNSAGQMFVASTPAAPNAPFHAYVNLSQDVVKTLIGPTTAVVALDRVIVSDPYDQTNGAPIDVV